MRIPPPVEVYTIRNIPTVHVKFHTNFRNRSKPVRSGAQGRISRATGDYLLLDAAGMYNSGYAAVGMEYCVSNFGASVCRGGGVVGKKLLDGGLGPIELGIPAK